MNFSDRLKALITALGCKNISAFESEVRVTQKTFANVINKGTDTGYKNIVKIWENFPNVNLDWLLTGRGDMFVNDAMNDDSTKQGVAGNVLSEKQYNGYGSNNYHDDYIRSIEDHVESLKLESRDKQEIINMFVSGKIIANRTQE